MAEACPYDGRCYKCGRSIRVDWATCCDGVGDICTRCEKALTKANIDPWTGEPL